MTFTIHSIGDSAFLEQILIAVSMVTGTGDFTQMVAIGMLLGVIMVCVQSIMQGARNIEFQHILMGWVLYACLFGVGTTVVIEDAYTGQVRPVDNVPVGVAAAGSIISNIGYKLTDLFETGYGIIVPTTTETPPMESLQLLLDVRRHTYDPMIFEAMNQALGGGAVDVRKSINNYIRECTLTKVDLGKITFDQLMREPTSEALRFISQLYGTRLFLDGSEAGQNLTCDTAWTALDYALGTLSSPMVQDALADSIGADTTEGANMIAAVDDALQAMGAISISASDYMTTALLEPLYYEAVAGRYKDLQDYAAATAINEAIKQRNAQWASDQTMFMTLVRPLLTFFEGFIYAITPLMAFLIMLGSFGTKLAGRYFQTLIWIQLWYPVMAIIQLYIYTAAAGEMASYTTDGIVSMYTLARTSDVLGNWIATGGMMAAATPMITLFLVSGSTFAWTHLAGKMGGGGADFFDENKISPDLMSRGPVVESMPDNKFNRFSGILATGSESTLSSLSMGSQLSDSMASAHQKQAQTSAQFQNTLGRSLTSGANQAQTLDRLSSVGRTLNSTNSSQAQYVDKQAKSFMQQAGISDQHAAAVKGALAGYLSGSYGLPGLSKMIAGLGSEVGGKASGEKSSTDSTNWSAEDTAGFVDGLDWSESDSAALTNQLAEQYSSRGGEQFQDTWGDERSQQLKQSASALTSANDSYTRMSQLQNQLGSATNTDFRTLGAQIARSPEAGSALNNYFRYQAPQAVKAEAAALQQRYESSAYNMSPGVAKAAARLTAMTNVGNYDSGESLGGFRAATNAIGIASGRNMAFEGDPNANSGLAEPNVDADALRGQVHADTDGSANVRNEGNAAAIAGTAHQTPQQDYASGRIPENGSGLAQQDYANNRSHLKGKADHNQKQRSMPEEQAARQNIMEHQPPMSLSTAGLGALDRFASGAIDRFTGESGASEASLGTPISTLAGSTGWFGDMNYEKALIPMAGKIPAPPEDMSLKAKGAYYATAQAQAAQQGTEAKDELWANHGKEMRAIAAQLTEQAYQTRYNLTDSQTAVMKASTMRDQEALDQATHNLKMNYALQNPDGSPMMQNGEPVLSPADEKFTDSMIDALGAAPWAGARAGSYLTNISKYNVVSRGFN